MKSGIHFSEEFYKRDFVANTMKAAYMKAVKWYATNVLSKAELQRVHVEFIKGSSNEQSSTITIHLFAVLDDEQEVFRQHCECCEEMHQSFFINENNNCNICAAKGYQNRIEQGIRIKRDYYKELLEKYMEEEQ